MFILNCPIIFYVRVWYLSKYQFFLDIKGFLYFTEIRIKRKDLQLMQENCTEKHYVLIYEKEQKDSDLLSLEVSSQVKCFKSIILSVEELQI